jgi:hypothetical protein
MNSTYFIEQVMRDGNMQYGVYSLKDKSLPHTEENREYTGFYADFNTACYIAAELNIEVDMT